MPAALLTCFALPLRALAWLGRQGTRAIAALVLIGIALPPLGEMLKPYVAEAIFLLLCISFMRVDIAALRDHLRRPGIVLAASAWTMIAVPALIGIGCLAAGVDKSSPESVSRIDAAGGRLADDGRAGAGCIDGPRLDAGADHAGDRHRAGAADRAAVRLDVFRQRADAVAARSRLETRLHAGRLARRRDDDPETVRHRRDPPPP